MRINVLGIPSEKISAKCHENIKMIIKKITVEKLEINGRY